eukprot:PhF_6_TR10610/c0_g1_i3/m.17110
MPSVVYVYVVIIVVCCYFPFADGYCKKYCREEFDCHFGGLSSGCTACYDNECSVPNHYQRKRTSGTSTHGLQTTTERTPSLDTLTRNETYPEVPSVSMISTSVSEELVVGMTSSKTHSSTYEDSHSISDPSVAAELLTESATPTLSRLPKSAEQERSRDTMTMSRTWTLSRRRDSAQHERSRDTITVSLIPIESLTASLNTLEMSNMSTRSDTPTELKDVSPSLTRSFPNTNTPFDFTSSITPTTSESFSNSNATETPSHEMSKSSHMTVTHFHARTPSQSISDVPTEVPLSYTPSNNLTNTHPLGVSLTLTPTSTNDVTPSDHTATHTLSVTSTLTRNLTRSRTVTLSATLSNTLSESVLCETISTQPQCTLTGCEWCSTLQYCTRPQHCVNDCSEIRSNKTLCLFLQYGTSKQCSWCDAKQKGGGKTGGTKNVTSSYCAASCDCYLLNTVATYRTNEHTCEAGTLWNCQYCVNYKFCSEPGKKCSCFPIVRQDECDAT